ncbi:MAG: ABC transporter permease [Acidobacteria bacterium]|nr:ABC transporter permease [Acidobacteriota bacterium]
MNFRRFAESLSIAFETLRSNKFRSFLTIFGVVIGTLTVMAVSSFVSGLDKKFEDEMTAFGTRSIWVYKFDPTFSTGRRSFEERTRKPISYEDAVAIREHCPSIEIVAPMVQPDEPRVHANGEELFLDNVNGTTPDYERIESVQLTQGRFFNETENLNRRPVAVIGADIATTFWPTMSPLGKKFMIDNNELEVVGVLEKRDNFFIDEDDGGNVNRGVYIPYQTMLKFYSAASEEMKENFVTCQYFAGKREAAYDEVRQILRQRREVPFNAPDNFALFSPDSVTQKFQAMTSGVFLLMIALSSAGLAIGGIGVMNIMLVSVTERTKEIGVRKAIGARRGDIIVQFLIEAAVLTGMGGVIGILLGWGVALLISLILPSFVPLWAPIFGFAVSVSIGLGFGLWPAIRASRLDPIDALRYE